MIQWSDDDFLELVNAFESQHHWKRGTVGYASSKLFEQVPLVDFAAEWLSQNR